MSSLIAGQNTSHQDSSKHDMSGSKMMDEGASQSTAHKDNDNLKANFYRVKNTFDILIREASYLIDDKSVLAAEGKSESEQFLINVDSIRKSLGIEEMEDVELLVQTFYDFGEKKRK